MQQQQAPQQAPPPLRTLHPPPEPQGAFDMGQLQVSDIHTIHFYQYGNPQGLPAVFLHGGPGAAAWPNHARFFDLRVWRVVLLDQRGCGASTPRGCLVDNTTEALVGDLEALREHLGIASWLVLGGSWGVALALAYASAHPDRVTGLVLRGICLMRPQEIDWMYRPGGASLLKPVAWANFVEGLPAELRQGDVLSGYLQLLTSPDAATRDRAARSWMDWGFAVGGGSSRAALTWDGSTWTWNAHPLPQSLNSWGRKPRPDAQPLQQLMQQQQRQPQQWQQQGAGQAGELSSQSRDSQQKRPVAAAAAAAAANVGGHPAPLKAAGASGQQRQNASGTPLPPRRTRTKNSSRNVQAAVLDTQAANSTTMGSSSSGGGSGPAADAGGVDEVQRAEVLARALAFPGDNAMPSATAQALLECAYSAAYAFGLHHHPLLAPDRIASLQVHGVRCIAIQGEADHICPPANVWDLHRAWPQMQLIIVPEAGHSQYDPRITHELVCAVESMQRNMLGC